jgi:predicted ester cyclase
MTPTELSAIYDRYLQCLNERRWSELGNFVSKLLSYNGKQMSLDGYRAMLEADARAIPDLQFTPELLVADADIVACRLLFRCTPRHNFLGFEPTGAPIAFSEHVFYKFDESMIVAVWSLIDTQAIAAQSAQ